MIWTATEIAERVGGSLYGCEHPETLQIRGIRSLSAATSDHMSFVRSARHRNDGAKSAAALLLVPADQHPWQRPVVQVADPDQALVVLLSEIAAARRGPGSGVHPTAVIAEGVELGEGVHIGPHVVIEPGARLGGGTRVEAGTFIGARVELGRGCDIAPRVTLMAGTRIGANVQIHSGTVIGADGFGYVQHQGKHVKLPHVGGVVIEDDVEIGALTTIDQGMVDPTIVRHGAKIDDHCHIAHNCDIGAQSLLAGGCQLSGSVTVGAGAVLGGAVGVSDNLNIGNGAQVGGGSKLFSDVAPGAKVWGYPAIEARSMLKAAAIIPRLPEIRQRLRQLERHHDSAE